MEFKIFPKKPFSILPHLRKFCREDIPTPCLFKEESSNKGSCRRIIKIDNELIPYKVFINEEKQAIEVKVFCKKHVRKVINLVKEVYRVNFDYEKFLENCKLNEEVYSLAKKYEGLRPTKFHSLYEALIDTIIEQNINVNFAIKIKGNFVKSYGERKIIEGESYFSFPDKEVISKLNARRLKKKIRVTLSKAKAIIEVSKVNLPSIKWVERHEEEFVDFITRIKGIGSWTAKLTLAKVSRSFKFAPLSDLAVKRGFKKLLGIKDEKEIEEFVKFFDKYKGLVLYLFAFDS